VNTARVSSGAVLVAIAVAAVWYAPPALFLAIAIGLVILASIEYAGLARASKLTVPAVPAAAAAGLACLSFSNVAVGRNLGLDVVLLSALVALGAVAIAVWRGDADAVGSSAAALATPVYVGLPLGALVAIRETDGPQVLFLLMLTIMASDIAQYYTGRAFGRRPLAPRISPGKTVEGAIGGLVVAALVLAVVGHWWLPAAPPAFRAILGLVIGVLGIVGDLFESSLKRGAGLKDSSSLIPGHGGVLDRIDALLFAAPVYYIVLKYL
jgi:phosphatidate cytidylyltransferase